MAFGGPSSNYEVRRVPIGKSQYQQDY